MWNVKKKNDDFLEHHGILGMHWGVRRTPEQLGHRTKSKKSNSAKEQRKWKVKQAAKRTAEFVGTSLLVSTVYNVANSSAGRNWITSGKSFVDSYLKSNGTKKVSDIQEDKSWADYAWEEVEKPHP